MRRENHPALVALRLFPPMLLRRIPTTATPKRRYRESVTGFTITRFTAGAEFNFGDQKKFVIVNV